jgi:hypothetical protein
MRQQIRYYYCRICINVLSVVNAVADIIIARMPFVLELVKAMAVVPILTI